MPLAELARSFAGCDGGRIRAELWVCGIEPYGDAGTIDAAQPHLSPHSPEWCTPPCWPAGFATSLLDGQPLVLPDDLRRAWRPRRRVSYDWLLAALCSRVFEGADNAEGYLRHRLYQAAGDIFKLNLFPLACRRDTQERWSSDHQQRSDCALKRHYTQQVLEHRGRFFRALIAEHKPRVILCTGAARRDDFVSALLPGGEEREPVTVNGRAIPCYRDDALNCRLLAAPFLGTARGMLGELDLVPLSDVLATLLRPPAQ